MNMHSNTLKLLILLLFSCCFWACPTSPQNTEETTMVASPDTTITSTSTEVVPVKAIETPEDDSPAAKAAPKVWTDSLPIVRGEFLYMADAALFFPCNDKKGYPVVMADDFISLESAYMEVMGDDVGQRAFITVEGKFTGRERPDQPGKRSTLSVTKFISVTRKIDCEASPTYLIGNYTPSDDLNGVLENTDSKETTKVKWAMPSNFSSSSFVNIEGFVMNGSEAEEGYFLATRLVGVE